MAKDTQKGADVELALSRVIHRLGLRYRYDYAVSRDSNTNKPLHVLGWTAIKFWPHDLLADAAMTLAQMVAATIESNICGSR